MKIFMWCWIGLFTTTVLPFAVAALRGWAPRWGWGRRPRARIQVQGVSLLVLYVAAMAHPVFWLSGIPREDADFFLPVLSPGLMLLAVGLQAGAALNDWFGRSGEAHEHHAPPQPGRAAEEAVG
ncbi:hypothetical protein [Streptomyces wuyuanensis]|uniref:hypothetical protein n=1 Tax=Streptomyces wuyuanensis TaxID=1196353 RepID=UPI003710CCB1